MDLKLKGKTALITGGARGIGLAEARQLGEEGANIIINDIDAQAADEAVGQLCCQGIEAIAVAGDAADEGDVEAVVSAVTMRTSRIDILVNNAGLGVKPAYPVKDMSVEAWDGMIQSHMRSTFLLTRQVIPFMQRYGFGRIVNTSSMNFTGGGRPGVAHYTAAKAGIAGFTRTAAKELGPLGITVNAIAPGYVQTALISQFSHDMRRLLEEQNPVGRMCTPEEVGALVAFLASEQAAFINGELVCMDGGRRDFFWGN